MKVVSNASSENQIQEVVTTAVLNTHPTLPALDDKRNNLAFSSACLFM